MAEREVRLGLSPEVADLLERSLGLLYAFEETLDDRDEDLPDRSQQLRHDIDKFLLRNPVYT